MIKHQDYLTDRHGNAIANAHVLVKLTSGVTPTIYSNVGATTVRTNPLTTDASGFYWFFAEAGHYTFTITLPDGGIKTVSEVFVPADDLGGVSFLPEQAGKNGYILQTNGTSASWVPLACKNIKTDFGAVGDGVTDDTLALQAMFDYAEANNGVNCYFPSGTYLIGGDFQDPTDRNAQLLLPEMYFGDTAQIPITMWSDKQPSLVYSLGLGGFPLPTSGAIIKTTKQGTGVNPTLIGGNSGNLSYLWTNVNLKIQNMRFVTYDNPNIIALNLGYAITLELENVVIDTGVYYLPDITEPSHPSAFGLLCPANNNGAFTYLKNVVVTGYRTGIYIGEHAFCDNVMVVSCWLGFEVPAMNHPWTAPRIFSTWCLTAMKSTIGASRCFIGQFGCERAVAGWQSVGAVEVSDAPNYMIGQMNIYVGAALTGPTTLPNITGGTNLIVNVF